MRERLKDKRQRWKAEQGHRQNRHWADRAIWSQPDHVTSDGGVDSEDLWYTASTEWGLNFHYGYVNPPALGYTTSTTHNHNAVWVRVVRNGEDTWVRVPEWHRTHTFEALQQIPADIPALAYVSGEGRVYSHIFDREQNRNVWVKMGYIHERSSSPSGDVPTPGELCHVTDRNSVYAYTGDGWVNLTHWEF